VQLFACAAGQFNPKPIITAFLKFETQFTLFGLISLAVIRLKKWPSGFPPPLATRQTTTCLAAIMAMSPALWLALDWWINNPSRAVVSKILARTCVGPQASADDLRPAFTNLVITPAAPTRNHSHGQAAATRSQAGRFIDEIAEKVGLTPYYYQMSRHDIRRGREGSRSFYWTKDCQVLPRETSISGCHLLAMVDVDYYVDMPEFLNNHYNPVILYTVYPTATACTGNNLDYSFTFMEDNTMDYRASGGAHYRHHVWNYTADNFKVVSYTCGIPTRMTSYLVDTRQVDAHHSLVLLTPFARWEWASAALADKYMDGSPLLRLTPSVVLSGSSYARLMVVVKGSENYISTSLCGEYEAAIVPCRYDEAIATTATLTKNNLQVASVQAFIDADLDDAISMRDKRSRAAILTRFHRDAVGYKSPPPVVAPVAGAVQAYDYCVAPWDFDDTYKLVSFMNPFIDAAFTPVNSEANDKAFIKGRVTSIAHKPGTPPLTPFLTNVVREFVECFLPIRGTHEPTDLDEVYERQGRPSQRQILEYANYDEYDSTVKSFIKAEAYGEPKDPRGISTICGPDKRDYSQFIYPLADTIKTMDWYAFGKPPVEVASRVAELCLQATNVLNTDFSRFDGHVSHILRHLERQILLRAYPREYQSELTRLHESQMNRTAITTFGFKYSTGTARLSGSPETAAFNSLANAFVAFLAFRKSIDNVTGQFYTPRRAWQKLGIYGGDDGLTTDVNPKIYEKAATDIGLKLTASEVRRSDPGTKVTFLARYYSPSVWEGDPSSCCDIPRTLTKLHTSPRLNVLPTVKMYEKLLSLSYTDSNTPIIGPLVKRALYLADEKVIEYAEKHKELLSPLRKWVDSNFDLSVNSNQPPNDDHCLWMDTYARESLAPFNFDHEQFHDWLQGCNSLEDMLKAPTFGEPIQFVPKVPVRIGGEIFHPPPAPATVKLRAASRLQTHRKPGSTSKPPIKVADQRNSPPQERQLRHNRDGAPRGKKEFARGVKTPGPVGHARLHDRPPGRTHLANTGLPKEDDRPKPGPGPHGSVKSHSVSRPRKATTVPSASAPDLNNQVREQRSAQTRKSERSGQRKERWLERKTGSPRVGNPGAKGPAIAHE
jgi:hypothetical protein